MKQYAEQEAFKPRVPLQDPQIRNGLTAPRLKSPTELQETQIVNWNNLQGNPSDNEELLALLTNFQTLLGYIPLAPINNLSELTDTAQALANLGLGLGGINDIFLRKDGGTMTGKIVFSLLSAAQFQANNNLATASTGDMDFDGEKLYFTPDIDRKMISFNEKDVVTKTVDYTVTAFDEIILVDATAADTTITLPTAVGNTGRSFSIKKIDASVNIVIVEGDGTETIDGDLTRSLLLQYDYIVVISDGANWLIIGGN